MKVLVTGGGTGGHVVPALAVISAVRARDPLTAIVYVGSAAGIEARLVTAAGIRFESVATGKLRRSSSGVRGLLTRANLRDALRVPLGAVQAWRLMGRERPDVVLSTGGYVGVPTVIAAWARRCPVLLHEQTLTIGLANRIGARFAKRIALSWEESLADLPRRWRHKAIVTGCPVRGSLLRRTGSRFGLLDDRMCMYVTGGAQGARIINEAIRDAAPQLLTRVGLLHQCGAADLGFLQEARAALPPDLASRWVLVPFIEDGDIGEAYAVADVVVGRAGAGTVNDLCIVGCASVLVPLEPTGGDEQVRNGQRLVAAGAAVVVPQAECSAASLLAALETLLDDPVRRSTMAAAARQLARPDATDRLVDAILALCPTPNRSST